ncbi:integrase core domain-containing protein [Streptomyces sp. NBC_01446]|nr:integrase core domain-containing protein [Streptomyces sp. NBC_01446]
MNIAGIKFLIRDRGGQFTDAFDAVFTDVGLRVLKSPPQAPKANAHCERFNGTLRRELPDRTLIVNERHLSRTLTKYLEHYNGHRPHRALNQLCPSQAEAGPPRPTDLADHHVHHAAVLGGLINEYQTASWHHYEPADQRPNPIYLSPTGRNRPRTSPCPDGQGLVRARPDVVTWPRAALSVSPDTQAPRRELVRAR